MERDAMAKNPNNNQGRNPQGPGKNADQERNKPETDVERGGTDQDGTDEEE